MSVEKIARRHKGDASFSLEKNDDIYHFKKNIKVRSKKLTQGISKTTRVVVSDFYFKQGDVESINFTENGLREGDKPFLIAMMEDLNEQ